MHKPEFIQENETYELQTDHLIQARRSDLVIVKKKKEPVN